MFSRLVAFAASLVIVGAASFALTASAQPVAASTGAKQVRVVQLQHVVVTAKRLSAGAR